jgi:HSP20 family protein
MPSPLVPKDNGSPPSRPVDVFDAMKSEMDRVFDRFHRGWSGFADWPSLPRVFGTSDEGIVVPELDLKDTGKTVVIEAELPGVDEKDVTLTVKDGILTIKGEKRQKHEEKGESHYVMERSYGSFMRSIRLPESIDENKVDAAFDKGVLTITAQKKPEAVKAEKRIEIQKKA